MNATRPDHFAAPAPGAPSGLLTACLLAIACSLMASCVAGAAPGDTTRAARPAAGVAPDFSEYQKLLNDLLTVTSARGEPLDARFDYEKFYDVKGRYERVSRIKKQLMAVPPSRMDERARLAWAINVYNFTVLENGTTYLLIPSRGRQRYLSLRDIKVSKAPFFQAPTIEAEGRKYSLDEFERHFLLADFDRARGGVPPAQLDPRVHFALVCGALGCPPLLPRAFRPESLEIQLDFATRNALALPRHLRVNEATGALETSAIFDWYAADFGGPGGAVGFIGKYAPPKVRKSMDSTKSTPRRGAIPWDWNLNQSERKREI